jgi:hypothetical protein
LPRVEAGEDRIGHPADQPAPNAGAASGVGVLGQSSEPVPSKNVGYLTDAGAVPEEHTRDVV